MIAGSRAAIQALYDVSSVTLASSTNDQSMPMPNLFGQIPTALPDEVTETLVAAGNVRIERIVSCGHASPDDFWYDQKANEWVLLVQGAARLQFDRETVELKPGDWINIQAGRKHRVQWTAPDQQTIWLAVFYE